MMSTVMLDDLLIPDHVVAVARGGRLELSAQATACIKTSRQIVDALI